MSAAATINEQIKKATEAVISAHTPYKKDVGMKQLQRLLKQHKVTVIAWSVTSCGYAHFKSRKVKIPTPTDIDRFCVCLHEIKHCIDGKLATRFIEEYECEKFAIETAAEFGYDVEEYTERSRRHIIVGIAKAHNRGYDVKKLPQEIKDFCQPCDFTAWAGNKVFASGWGTKQIRNKTGFKIDLTPALKNPTCVYSCHDKTSGKERYEWRLLIESHVDRTNTLASFNSTSSDLGDAKLWTIFGSSFVGTQLSLEQITVKGIEAMQRGLQENLDKKKASGFTRPEEETPEAMGIAKLEKLKRRL